MVEARLELVAGDRRRYVGIDRQISRLVPRLGIGRLQRRLGGCLRVGCVGARRSAIPGRLLAVPSGASIGGRHGGAAMRAARELGREEVGERIGPVAGEARLLLLPVARKEHVEAEEVEADDRLLQRPPDRLRVQKGQHHLVTRGRGKAEVEDVRIGPAGVSRIETDLDPRTPQRDHGGLDPLHLGRLRGEHVQLVERPHDIDAGQTGEPNT